MSQPVAVTVEMVEDQPSLVLATEQAYVTETATGLAFVVNTPIEVWGALVERLQRQQKVIEWAVYQEWRCGKIVGIKSPRRVGSTRGRHRGVSSMPRQYTPRVAMTCARCGEPFTRPQSKAAGARFCGRTCYFAARRSLDPQERFWAMVNKTDTCWLWQGSKADGGYGKFNIGGVLYPAHRVAYQWLVGPIPEGLHLDHLCRVTNCVNPAHMEPVTTRENLLRGVGPSAVNARKMVCDQGHPLAGENLYSWRGDRHCRICRKAASDARHERARMARAAGR
jgi:hypothetical protein